MLRAGTWYNLHSIHHLDDCKARRDTTDQSQSGSMRFNQVAV
jgi:hypothetical protein